MSKRVIFLAKALPQIKGYATTLFNVSIRHALRDELSWTHYRFLMRVENSNAITPKGWEKECAELKNNAKLYKWKSEDR